MTIPAPDKLSAALKPFAELAKYCSGLPESNTCAYSVKVADLRRAAEAYAALEALPTQSAAGEGVEKHTEIETMVNELNAKSVSQALPFEIEKWLITIKSHCTIIADPGPYDDLRLLAFCIKINVDQDLRPALIAMLSASPAPSGERRAALEDDWMGIELTRKQNIAMRDAVKYIDQNIPESVADAFYEIGPRHSGADTDYYCRIERWQHEPKIDTCVRKATPMECAIEAVAIFKQPYRPRAALAAISEPDGRG